MKDRFLIIGSNSFSGSHFTAYVISDGADAVGISRSKEPSRVFLPYKWMDGVNFRFHRLDLNHNLDKIIAVINDYRPGYIINFSAQSMVGQSWESPEDWFMTNTVAMARLHDKLRKYTSLKMYVHVSTPEVYGAAGGLVRESSEYKPSTPYAVSKAACDMNLHAYHKAYDFPVVLIRAANVCGPGQQLYRIIPKAILCILLGNKLKLEGGGTSIRSFIHIRDVCEGMLRAARLGSPGEVFHFATNQSISIRELVEKICDYMGASFDNLVEISGERRGKDFAYLLDCTKAHSQLDWKAKYSLGKIISETADWMKANLDILKEQPFEYIHKK